jgi:hypothetical protein
VEATQATDGHADRQAVLATMQALFAGIASRDREAIRATLLPEAVLVHAYDGKIIHRTVAETVASVQPGTSQLEERTHNTVVLVDHDIAMVWAPYVFCFDGVPHHEGTNIFSFVKQPDGRWLISGLTDNGRTLAG